ncbi:MAG TPA: hypothetical protein VFS39_13260 [Nitrospira sp.]|nr:hypothetical protein [Nitrospira sp.]
MTMHIPPIPEGFHCGFGAASGLGSIHVVPIVAAGMTTVGSPDPIGPGDTVSVDFTGGRRLSYGNGMWNY